MSEFGAFLREKRTKGKKPMVLKEVSAQLKRKDHPVDVSTLSRWENGKRSPGLDHRDTIVCLADILGLAKSERRELRNLSGLWPTKLRASVVRSHAMQKHLEDLETAARLWAKDVYLADSEEELITRGFFPTWFKPTDGNPGSHHRGSLKWAINEQGLILHIWLEAEEVNLFGALGEHVAGTVLWKTYEELKLCLANGIQESARLRCNVGVQDEARDLRKRLKGEIEILLRTHMFPGKCSICRDWGVF